MYLGLYKFKYTVFILCIPCITWLSAKYTPRKIQTKIRVFENGAVFGTVFRRIHKKPRSVAGSGGRLGWPVFTARKALD